MSGSHPKADARRALRSYLGAQRDALLAGDVALRQGDDEVIHKTRVATRRLRSALRVFAPLFDQERAAALDGELRWYAELLGNVRDSQVLKDRLAERLAELPPELVLGPVQQRIDSHLDSLRARDGARLRDELEQPRYAALLAEITEWVDSPPFTDRAAVSEKAMTRLVGKATKKVRDRLRTANATGDVDLLHRARKSAKRARYGAETIGPLSGGSAERKARQYEALQDLLGEHQDSVVAAQLLRELGAAAGVTPGENGFTYGLLFEREQERAATARRKAREAARRYR
jgi:CHAD domain-containing protein